MSSLGYKTPEIYAYSSDNTLHIPSSKDHIKEKSFLLSFEKLLSKNNLEEVFIKPFDELGGKDCFLYKNSYKNIDSMLDKVYSNFLFQEVLKQNKEINKIYPSSINTIRIYTLKDEEGKVIVTSGVMRFGINGSNTDNASSGGFFVPINIECGTLEKEGIQFLKHGGNTYTKHPDTGYKFQDFKIPRFDEIINKAKIASEHFSNKMIGWDLVVTEDEVVFMEGNSNGSLLMAQIACGGFDNQEIYSQLLK